MYANTVKFTAAAAGTGSFGDGTAATGFRNLAGASLVNTGLYTYRAWNPVNPSEWENGRGTYSSSGPVLARTTVYESSNAGSVVDFSNAPIVVLTPLAVKMTELDRVTLSCFLPGALNNYGTVTLLLDAPYPIVIDSVAHKCTTNAVTLNFRINTVSITGLSAVSVTSTKATTNASAANVMAAGDTLDMVLSANIASDIDLHVTVHGRAL